MQRRASLTLTTFIATVLVAVACGGKSGETSAKGAQQAALIYGDPYLVCLHLQIPWSDEWCPDSNPSFRVLDSVTAVSVSITTLDGKVHVTTINPKADAIFLTQMSVDSVLAGYYASKAGKDPASARKLKAIRDRKTPAK